MGFESTFPIFGFILVAGSIGAALERAFAPGAPAACQLTGLRLACNAFRHPPLLAWVQVRGQ